MVTIMLAAYILGMFTGVGIFILFGIYQLRQMSKKRAGLVEEVKKATLSAEEKIAAIKDRMMQVQELTKKQIEMMARIDEPSKNALHSKYKNELNFEVKELEGQKNNILKTILKDGFDPTITILNAQNEREKIKLSEYMTRSGISWQDVPVASPDDPTAKKVGKFIVYTGGGNDEGNTTH